MENNPFFKGRPTILQSAYRHPLIIHHFYYSAGGDPISTSPSNATILGMLIRKLSGARESRLRALPKPDMNLSTHPAPIVQP